MRSQTTQNSIGEQQHTVDSGINLQHDMLHTSPNYYDVQYGDFALLPSGKYAWINGATHNMLFAKLDPQERYHGRDIMWEKNIVRIKNARNTTHIEATSNITPEQESQIMQILKDCESEDREVVGDLVHIIDKCEYQGIHGFNNRRELQKGLQMYRVKSGKDKKVEPQDVMETCSHD